MKKVKWTELFISIVSAELVGTVSALISGGFGIFYAGLDRPPLSPPGWLFPVVWTILYALMGISAYIISQSEDRRMSAALTAYAAQLAVNFSWSIIFFRFKALSAAAVTAIILAVLVAVTIYMFGRIKKLAALLNIPYLIWAVFAAYLAVGTALLN